MKQHVPTFFLLLTFPFAVFAQGEAKQAADKLDQFRIKGSAQDRFDHFIRLDNRYSDHTAKEWLAEVQRLEGYQKKLDDPGAMDLYRIIRAQILQDLGRYEQSAALVRTLLKPTDSTAEPPTHLKRRLYRLQDKNFGALNLFREQIEVREQRIAMGDSTVRYDIFERMGLYEEAKQDYLKSVRDRKGDDLFESGKWNRIGYYQSKAPLTDKQGAVRKAALENLGKAERLVDRYLAAEGRNEIERAQAERLRAEIDGNLGSVLVAERRYKEAVPYLSRTIRSLGSSGDPEARAKRVDFILAMARAQIGMGRFSTARTYLARTGGDVGLTLDQRILRNSLYARYHTERSQFQRANRYLMANQPLTDSLRSIQIDNAQKQVHVKLVEIDQRMRQAEREEGLARREREEQAQVNEETRSTLNTVFISLVLSLIGFMGLVYAYNRSIAHQKLIEHQKSVIEGSLREKESLLKEIHHRVKNNLQMVSSLLSLQTKNTKDRSAIMALEEGKGRVKAMALIHQKLYQNDDLSVVEMQGYIESLINSVQAVYKKGGHNIDILVEAQGTQLDIDQAIPIGLILNELVSNSFKYAFPDGDEEAQIYIQLKRRDGEGVFEYTDNGIGFPEDSGERTKSSMGIRLVNRLVNQLQSKLNIDHSRPGVRFWFHFR